MTTRTAVWTLLTALFAAPASGQDAVEILTAQVGLPPGRFTDPEKRDDNGQASYICKNGTWAPVYTRLRVVREVRKKLAVVVEGKDADGLGTSYAVPLPDLTQVPPGTVLEMPELPLVPYVRPSGQEIEVSVKEVSGGDPAYWRSRAQPFRIKYVNSRDVSRFVVLSLGSKLPGLELPQSEQANVTLTGDSKLLRNGRVETAAFPDVALMPDQWFGYSAADVVVLPTGAVDANFLNALFADPNRKPKLDALREWVRRGGKLIISVGVNAALASQFEQLRDLLPLEINRADPATRVGEVALEWFTAAPVSGSGFRAMNGTLQPRTGTFAVANLLPKADRAARTLVPNAGDGRESRQKTVVQSAYGLGRVTLVAFDLDASPFTEFADRAKVWDLLLKETTAPHAPVKSAKATQYNNYNYRGYYNDTEDGLATALRTHVDTFEGVPVISFGWVAAFILLYTLLIGPVEYFVLKKVFKRLELTWITFPIIVLTVSAVAYFTAYSLKGDDLKVNKVDVVDVDPASGRVYGRTWFTVFSPRIDNYTVGLTPADGWNADALPATIDWFGGTQQGKQGGFFSRKYHYRTDGDAEADGLVNVPIQVWSTKAFTGEWSARTAKDAPAVVSNLTHPPADRTKVTGTFTLNLPLGELKDVRLLYAGKAYKYDGTVTPGAAVTVFLDESKRDTEWVTGFAAVGGFEVKTQQPGQSKIPVAFGTHALMPALFAEAGTKGDDGPATDNASLRRLDQSWRLTADNRDEVILVARTAPTVDDAERAMTETDGVSPTKLWLKGLPGPGATRTPVPGTLRQETYVRVYVPVKPAGK